MRIFFITCLAITFLTSCLKNTDSSVSVSTEDILFVSGERLVVTGRILATSQVEVSDHGFLISKDESFSNAEKLSLGERTLPGNFVGEYKTLEIKSTYYVKSFIETASGIIEGAVITFQTLEPIIDSFSPLVGFPQDEIVLRGRNLTSDAKVFIGGREATVVSVVDESIITAKIPNFAGQILEEIEVVFNSTSFVLDRPFEYVIGEWSMVDNFINSDNYFSHINFRSGNEIVFGLGAINGFGPYKNDMNAYNIQDQTWREIQFPGPGVGFSFSLPGVIGSGSFMFVRHTDLKYELNDLYYTYNDGEFRLEGNLPFELLKAQGEKVGDKGYVFGGLTEEIYYNAMVYSYDYDQDTWKLDGFLPDHILTSTDLPSFVYNGNPYFIAFDNKMYKYNVVSKGVEFVSDFPSSIPEDGIAEVIGDKVYIGLGANRRDLFEFDFSTSTWKPKESFISTASDRNVASWVEDEELYILKNRKAEGENMIVWKFSPEEF